jgi:hypothetical protein
VPQHSGGFGAGAGIDDFRLHVLNRDALLLLVAEQEWLAVLEVKRVLGLEIFFRGVTEGAVVEDHAVLIDLDQRGALVLGGALLRATTLRCVRFASAVPTWPGDDSPPRVIALSGQNAVPAAKPLSNELPLFSLSRCGAACFSLSRESTPAGVFAAEASIRGRIEVIWNSIEPPPIRGDKGSRLRFGPIRIGIGPMP